MRSNRPRVKKKKKKKAGRWSTNNGLCKSKMKMSTRLGCAMGERQKSSIQNHDLLGSVKKKANSTRIS